MGYGGQVVGQAVEIPCSELDFAREFGEEKPGQLLVVLVREAGQDVGGTVVAVRNDGVGVEVLCEAGRKEQGTPLKLADVWDVIHEFSKTKSSHEFPARRGRDCDGARHGKRSTVRVGANGGVSGHDVLVSEVLIVGDGGAGVVDCEGANVLIDEHANGALAVRGGQGSIQVAGDGKGWDGMWLSSRT